MFGSTYRPKPDEDGWFPIYNYFSFSPVFNDYSQDLKKIEAVFKSPALLKVITLQCDLFSLGKIFVYDKDGKDVKDDPIVKLLNNPNPLQSRSQFLWDFMFWNMLGNAYCYVDSNVVTNESNKLYFLENSKMVWPPNFEREKDKLIFSNKFEKEIGDTIITYRYIDGTSIQIPLSKIIINTDLTNGAGNWYKGNSRIDALYKIISNSEVALDAENINLFFSGKFLVAGTSDPKDPTKLAMTEPEKLSIEQQMKGKKNVHAVKSMLDIKRFVEDLKALDLPAQYLSQYFLIGNMYNIPRDVLEAYASSTYENQEKARASHVSYTLQPKGNDFLEALAKRFGYNIEGKKVCIDWSHLPFMQVFEKDKAITQYQKTQSMTNLLKLNVDIKEVNEFLGTNFKNAKYEQPKPKETANPGAN